MSGRTISAQERWGAGTPAGANDDTPERALLQALDGGDGDAFWKLWLRHRGHLYDVCLRRMNGLSCDAADAMSRSMMVACSKMPQYATGINNVQAWLTRLVLNVCSDIHREQRRMAVGVGIAEELVQLEQEHPQEQALSPEDATITHEGYACIVRAIAALPPRLRDVARMHFLHEAPYESISRKLSITPANVRKRVQHAREILKRTLPTRPGRNLHP
ncbi:MAG TPA: sigma-70 family RNA polymerase sigma factor [Thermoanaerobaculia bacterium]|nr:sigma-70 family RNA polymerase sigma factor [Thermoanaerobaculia bacterium]